MGSEASRINPKRMPKYYTDDPHINLMTVGILVRSLRNICTARPGFNQQRVNFGVFYDKFYEKISEIIDPELSLSTYLEGGMNSRSVFLAKLLKLLGLLAQNILLKNDGNVKAIDKESKQEIIKFCKTYIEIEAVCFGPIGEALFYAVNEVDEMFTRLVERVWIDAYSVLLRHLIPILSTKQRRQKKRKKNAVINVNIWTDDQCDLSSDAYSSSHSLSSDSSSHSSNSDSDQEDVVNEQMPLASQQFCFKHSSSTQQLSSRPPHRRKRRNKKKNESLWFRISHKELNKKHQFDAIDAEKQLFLMIAHFTENEIQQKNMIQLRNGSLRIKEGIRIKESRTFEESGIEEDVLLLPSPSRRFKRANTEPAIGTEASVGTGDSVGTGVEGPVVGTGTGTRRERTISETSNISLHRRKTSLFPLGKEMLRKHKRSATSIDDLKTTKSEDLERSANRSRSRTTSSSSCNCNCQIEQPEFQPPAADEGNIFIATSNCDIPHLDLDGHKHSYGGGGDSESCQLFRTNSAPMILDTKLFHPE